MRISKLIGPLILLTIVGSAVYYFYPEDKLALGTRIDKIVVNKAQKQLLAYSKGQLLKTYNISLRKPSGDKEFEGDKKTPEGVYFIDHKNPNSRYHKNLGISYPDQKDLEYAKQSGRSAGGDVKIHGLRNGLGFIGKFHRLFNWTLGCIAVTNEEMDELYNSVETGTRIEIRP